jgi:hypothetical protein
VTRDQDMSQQFTTMVDNGPRLIVLDGGQPNGAPRAPRKVGRPSKAAPFRERIVAMLEAEPMLSSLEILHRARAEGYAGGRSALYALVADLRSELRGPFSSAEDRPGALTQHDLGGVDVRLADGRRTRAYFAVSRLRYSRVIAASMLTQITPAEVVRGLYDHFGRLGGVPLVATFNHPRVVARRTAVGVEWDPELASAMLELGVGLDLERHGQTPRRGQWWDLSAWLKGTFFRSRTFASLADIDPELTRWTEEVNRVQLQDPRSLERATDDRARLRPLKAWSSRRGAWATG